MLDPAVARLVDAWELAIDGPALKTFGATVVFVRRAGRAAVLKVYGARSDEQRSADVLAHYDGAGAVRVLARDDDGVLLERAVPGTTLVGHVVAGEDDKATEIVADVIAALHGRPGSVDGLKTVAEWGEAFDRHLRRGGDPRLPAGLFDRAAHLHDQLCRSQGPPVVLHGDLHHYNILADEGRGWLAIDPKGIIGEAAYEVGASLRNPIDHPAPFDTPLIARRIAIFAERLGFDRERMVKWCFAQAVLSGVWAVEDGHDPAWSVARAEATLPLL